MPDRGSRCTDPAAPAPSAPPAAEGTLQEALVDARDALLEREAAYRANDLVAAAEADARLQEALERAIALSE